ncbi:MAG: hypothetical protein SFY96_12925 [Planctomycetota bacterium]|nr:hypothetical protein [Planctomycetota bacterium]
MAVWAVSAPLGSSAALADDAADAEAWVRSTFASSREFALKDVKIEWTVEDYAVPSADELARMRQEVAGHPAHPSRKQLEIYERRIKSGPDKNVYAAWFSKDGWARINQSYGVGEYIDVVIGPDTAWELVGGTLLNVFDPKNWPEGRKLGPIVPNIKLELGGFTLGGLSIRAGSAPLVLRDFSFGKDSRWRVVGVNTEHKLKIAYEGLWQTLEKSGFCDAAEVLESGPSPKDRGRRWEFVDWNRYEATNATVCSSGEEFTPTGKTVRKWRLDSIAPCAAGELSKVMRAPTLGEKSDAVRGALALAAVHDFSSGSEAVLLTNEPDGQTRKTPESDPPTNRVLSQLQIVTIASSALLIGTAIVVRMRRSAPSVSFDPSRSN